MPVSRPGRQEPRPQDEGLEPLSGGVVSERPSTRSFLYVVKEGSSAVVWLPFDGEIWIGSDGNSDVRVDEPGVAARHARIAVDDGEARLEPLGGSELTFVNREGLVAPRTLVPGDVIGIRGATIVFHRDGDRPQRLLFELEELRARLAEEADRAIRYGRALAVVVVDLGDPRQLARAQLLEAVERELRTADVAGWDGGTEIIIVLPETGDSAVTPVSRLLRSLQEVAPNARAGVATCPGDASDVNALIEGARSAAVSARCREVARVTDSVQRWSFSDCTVTIADPTMKRLFSLVQRLARSDLPVLITGDSGVGKEIVASALHAWSPRREKRFVSINCAAIPEALFESELFGHERGAFSGAVASKIGLFEAADGGTLFLDEVGECPPSEQAKLLRVLETKRLMRIGAVVDHAVDVRVVAATNRSLDADVASGRFRADLFFRLSAASVVVPNLRDRMLDLPVLARAFLDESCLRLGRVPPVISASTMHRLARYPWPGNLRELKNTMEYLAVTADGFSVEPNHLPERIAGAAPASGHGNGRERTASQPSHTGPFRNIYDEIRELERNRMIEALQASGGARRRAAELIGMPLRTFVTKLKEYDIDVPSRRPEPRSSSRRGV